MATSARNLLFLVSLMLCVYTPSEAISIENNSYSDIVIVIHPDVPENAGIIAGIREVFTEASAFLYEITE